MRKAGLVLIALAALASAVTASTVGVPAVRASAVTASTVTTGRVVAQSDDDDDAAERAAAEIAAARERANAAAEELFRTQSEFDLLQEEQTRLRDQLATLRDDVAELRADVESLAVSRFVASGSDGIPVLTDFRTPNDRAHADVLTDVIADAGATTLDDYEAARLRLTDAEAELEANEQALLDKQEELDALQQAAEEEVERLREAESQRLQDEAVREALEAQQREQQRQLEEIQRRQAENERRANPTPASASAAADALLAGPGNAGTSTGASGGTAGGRTGGGGGGSNPAGIGDGYVDAIVCPVQGVSAYGDTWGAPRSGGRRHQGVDMLAPTGTPLQAVVSGTVQHRSNTLGGLTVTLLGDNGNRYYYAHLSSYGSEAGRVEQAQVIGFIGDTGNATGVPHLHFEIRPGGGFPVNPTPSVRVAGC